MVLRKTYLKKDRRRCKIFGIKKKDSDIMSHVLFLYFFLTQMTYGSHTIKAYRRFFVGECRDDRRALILEYGILFLRTK